MMHRRGISIRKLLLWGIAALATIPVASAAFAQTVPKVPSTIPPRRSSQLQQAPAGVNSSLPRLPYLPWSERWWTRMFDAGIKYVRIGQYEDTSDQVGWDWVEQKKGQLRLGSGIDDYVNSLVENGTIIELQVLYGNPIYTSQAGILPSTTLPSISSIRNGDRGLYAVFWPPTTPEQTAAFLRYTKFLVDHFRGRVRYYSLWNEEDINYWNPYPNPQDYGHLLAAFLKTVHDADPDAKIVSGGLAERNPEFARRVLDACQCAGDLDVFAYHIYPGGFSSNTPPERMDSEAQENHTTVALRDAVSAYPGVRRDLQFWNDEYNSVTGYTPDMDESIQAKYVPRAIMYNWAEHIPTFVWELINDTNTGEGNDFGIINGKMLRPTDFQPKPVYYAIERTNALFGDTVRDPNIRIKLLDAKSLGAADDAPFFAYGFKSRTGKSIVAYWRAAKILPGHVSLPVSVEVSLRNSGITHPVLIDLDSDTVTAITWESETEQVLRLPVRDSVMAIADATYFDWAVLPEIPGGLTAKRTGKTVELKWQADSGEATSIVVEGRLPSSKHWVDLARLPANAHSYQVTDPNFVRHASFRVRALNQVGESGNSTIAYIGNENE
jgi:hypothetical protein